MDNILFSINVVGICLICTLPAQGQGYISLKTGHIPIEDYGTPYAGGMPFSTIVSITTPIATKEDQWPAHFIELGFFYLNVVADTGRLKVWGPQFIYSTTFIKNWLGLADVQRFNLALQTGFSWLTYDEDNSSSGYIFPIVGLRVQYYVTKNVGFLVDLAYDKSKILGIGLCYTWDQYYVDKEK